MRSLIIVFFIIILTGCGSLKNFIGEKETKDIVNSEGELIKKVKIKERTVRLRQHPHNPVIIKTKTWIFDKEKIIEYTIEKRKRTIADWEGKILKYKVKKENKNRK